MLALSQNASGGEGRGASDPGGSRTGVNGVGRTGEEPNSEEGGVNGEWWRAFLPTQGGVTAGGGPSRSLAGGVREVDALFDSFLENT